MEDKPTGFVPKWVENELNLKEKQVNLATQPCLKDKWGNKIKA
jgi:hypothetical protein